MTKKSIFPENSRELPGSQEFGELFPNQPGNQTAGNLKTLIESSYEYNILSMVRLRAARNLRICVKTGEGKYSEFNYLLTI